MVVERVRTDFSFLEDEVLGILVFGSVASGSSHSRSDIDVCIVAPEKDPYDVLKRVWSSVNCEVKGYDVHVFEELSLAVKHSVIVDHKVVYARSKGDLDEYFYTYRKLWSDQSKARGAL